MKFITQWVILQHAGDHVSHLIVVPEVDAEGIVNDFSYASFFTDKDGRAITDCFEGSQREWFSGRRQHKEIPDIESIAPTFATLKTNEDDLFANAQLRGQFYKFVIQFAPTNDQ